VYVVERDKRTSLLFGIQSFILQAPSLLQSEKYRFKTTAKQRANEIKTF
jgi:hypothetical protein